ncbi:MAG: hypothetical protein ABIO60_03000 [Aquaticitalea sp.]
MKQLMLITFLLISLTSCKNNEKKETEEPMTDVKDDSMMDTKKEPTLEVGCYVYNEKGDLVRFEITEIDGTSVKGKLNYAYAEKDKNEGTFDGVLTGDKLFGKYTYMSEGVESIRDVAFKVEKDQIIEGFGDLNDDGTTFKDTTKINYQATTPWKKGPCN